MGTHDAHNHLSRRQFLARSGAAMAGMTVASRALGGERPDKIILGEGNQRYECIHDWLMPPDNIKWGDTQGVCQDSQGRIYVTHTVNAASESPDAIVVFDKNGKFLKSWGAQFKGGGHGVEIRKEGREEVAYHCDTAHRQVVKTDLDGKVIWEKGLPVEAGVYSKDGKEARFVPTNIAFAPSGDFYVADGYGSHWIHQYTLKGEYVRTFGGPGAEEGRFKVPHGIWLDNRGREPLLVITDRENNRTQWFTLDGKYVKMVKDGMRRPCYFDTRGDMLLVPDLVSVVTILDGDNKVMTQLGDGASIPGQRAKPRSEWVPGKFIHPHAGKFLQNGDILIAEYLPTGRMTLLKKLPA
jgi:hypothetical protein